MFLSTVCILEQAWVTCLTHRGNIDETDDETAAGDAEHQQPLLHIGQMIADDVKYRAAQRDRASNTKNEHHYEEQNGEQLRYESEARQRIRIRDEGQTGAAADHLRDVFRFHLDE
ncbi:hypothetical protein DBV15_02507 [Temnothorax longispinosus]|uniref:Uncharacterized protein n=1 Tax=Temnothorax longispinosus TaxID=300112 RepID=A0A4S2KSF8_9HYME|nr:hypothetical protein DBV15_02507 [Temnothorax longispinosus]